MVSRSSIGTKLSETAWHTSGLAPCSGTMIFALSGDILAAAQGLRETAEAAMPARAESARANIYRAWCEMSMLLLLPSLHIEHRPF